MDRRDFIKYAGVSAATAAAALAGVAEEPQPEYSHDIRKGHKNITLEEAARIKVYHNGKLLGLVMAVDVHTKTALVANLGHDKPSKDGVPRGALVAREHTHPGIWHGWSENQKLWLDDKSGFIPLAKISPVRIEGV